MFFVCFVFFVVVFLFVSSTDPVYTVSSKAGHGLALGLTSKNRTVSRVCLETSPQVVL